MRISKKFKQRISFIPGIPLILILLISSIYALDISPGAMANYVYETKNIGGVSAQGIPLGSATGIAVMGVYIDGILKKTCSFPTQQEPFHCITNSETFSDGSHTYYAEAFDYPNRIYGRGQDKIFNIDGTPPQITALIHTPQNPTYYDLVTISASASDATGITSIELYADNVKIKTCYDSACSSQPLQYSTGIHTYYAKATDNGYALKPNVKTSNNNYFTIPEVDNTPPTVTTTLTPTEPDIYDVIRISTTATDSSGIQWTEIYIDGQLKFTCTGQSTCEYPSTLSIGSHTYQGKAKDNNNNIGVSALSNILVLGGGTQTFEIVFVPINFNDMNKFNAKVDSAVELFRQYTPFHEPQFYNTLQIYKIQQNCECVWTNDQYKARFTQFCYSEAMECANLRDENDRDLLVGVVDFPDVGGMMDGRDYAWVTSSPELNGDKIFLTHEILHAFKLCDEYSKEQYDASANSRRRLLLETGPERLGCINPWPSEGIGPRDNCNTHCSASNPGDCTEGTCGAYLGKTAKPFDVSIMGDWSLTEVTNEELNIKRLTEKTANPVGIDQTSYNILNQLLTNFVELNNEDVPTVELYYTIDQSDNVELKSSKITITEVLAQESPLPDYKVEVRSNLNLLTYTSNFFAPFIIDGINIDKTNVHQRLPITFGQRNHIIVYHNQNIIATFDIEDTDNDFIPEITDNCPGVTNPNQRNTDQKLEYLYPQSGYKGDGIGDWCDADDDNDGYSDTAEAALGTNSTKPCGTDGWPADLISGGIPISTNKVTITDLTSFLAPLRRLNTDIGSLPNNKRWDLVPGKGVFSTDINLQDLTSLIILTPPMFGGNIRAFNGPACPIPG